MNICELPFNQFLGLQISEYAGQKVVALEPRSHHLNHVGTVHASVLYSVAEASSGHALITRCDLDPRKTIALVRSSKVKYRRPAEARMIGLAEITDQQLDKFTKDLADRKRAFLDVKVRIMSADSEIVSAEFNWFVTSQTANRSPS